MRLIRIVTITLCVLFLSSSLPVHAEFQGPGYTCSDWASVEMASAIRLGFIPSELLGDCTRPITRREFAQVAFNYVANLQYNYRGMNELFLNEYCFARKIELAEPFADASDDKFITAARTIGIVQGRNDAIFDPDSAITRQEAAIILKRVYNCYSNTTTLSPSSRYYDQDRISLWALEGVNFVNATGIMLGITGNRFDPVGIYTVEQCIVTFLRMYGYGSVSRKYENVPLLTTVEQLETDLLAKYSEGEPLQLLKRVVVPTGVLLHCKYSNHQPITEALFIIYDSGGVRDVIDAIKATDEATNIEWGELVAWSYSLEKDGRTIDIHAVYASHMEADYVIWLDDATVAVTDFCSRRDTPVAELGFAVLNSKRNAGNGFLLLYEDNEEIIFCNSFGLWGYNLKEHCLFISVDLIKLFGTELSLQGEGSVYSVTAQVSADGKQILLKCAYMEYPLMPEEMMEIYLLDLSKMVYNKVTPDISFEPFAWWDSIHGYIIPGSSLDQAVYCWEEERWVLFENDPL